MNIALPAPTPKPLKQYIRLPNWIVRIRRYLKAHRWKIILRGLVTLFLLVIIFPFITVKIPAGKVGVVYMPLFGGTSISRPLREGLRLAFPWNSIVLYDTRIQVRKFEFETVSKDGLHLRLGIIYRYRLHPTTAGRLHKLVGPSYDKVLLEPAINAVVRANAAAYTSEEIYGDKRGELQVRIYRGIVNTDNHNLIEGGSDPQSTDEIVIAPVAGASLKNKKITDYVPLVELLDVQITEVRLPDLVRTAIEKKEEQKQIKEEYAFRIEREKLESERKRIEAEGIRDFQVTVQAGISDTYLRLRGIEATLELATSENAKTVIIGSGRDGMPLILNTEDGRATPARQSRRPKQAPTGKSARSPSVNVGSVDNVPPKTGWSLKGNTP